MLLPHSVPCGGQYMRIISHFICFVHLPASVGNFPYVEEQEKSKRKMRAIFRCPSFL